jgi:serine/threonine protein kinase
MGDIRRVLAVGPPAGTSTAPEDAALALKMTSGGRLSQDTMAREAEVLQQLQRAGPPPPCPRLLDLVGEGDPIEGLVLEWCSTDLERWWIDVLPRPDAIEPLCRALGEACRRVAEFHAFMASIGRCAIHADVKPRNMVLSDDGRWLLADYGASESRPLGEVPWEPAPLVLGTENFVAPEMLFNARKHAPAAVDTWSLAVSFLTLLGMRASHLRGRALPPEGTHAAGLRCQRMADVLAVREQEPGRFSGKDLDPTAFPSPGCLPAADRERVREVLAGTFFDPAREDTLARAVLALLDRALAVDPARRFARAADLGAAFDAVAARYWELEGSLPIPTLPSRHP